MLYPDTVTDVADIALDDPAMIDRVDITDKLNGNTAAILGQEGEVIIPHIFFFF